MKLAARLLILFAVLWGTNVLAVSPPLVPVQGVLTDPAGMPLEGDVPAQFSIYNALSGGDLLWTESQTVTVTNGIFSAYLGQATPLDLATFHTYGDVWLGIRVGDDPEMPRFRIGSSPFAGHAETINCGFCDDQFINVGESGDSLADNTVDSSEIEDGSITVADCEAAIAEAVNLRHARNMDSSLATPEGSANSLFVDSGAKVGIGTTVPGYRLEVNGTLGFTGGQGPFCIFAQQCPNGWTDRGLGGYLYNILDGNCPFTQGAVQADPWYWCHPRICCTS